MVACKKERKPGSPRRVSLLIIWAAALVAVAAISKVPPSVAADVQANTVGLVIDYGDGAEVRFK